MIQPKRLVLVVICILLCLVPVAAQAQSDDTTCSEIVATALQAVDEACADTARNEACYGNDALLMFPREGLGSISFRLPGDIAALNAIERLQPKAMDVDKGEWGVAVLKLQANLPDTLPGQNVTFLVFGDATMTTNVDADDETLQPMQAFYFTTGIGDQQCVEAPESGILVQTPDGAETVQLTANGVEIELGSTAFLQSTTTYMDVFLLEHQATVGVGPVTKLVPAGMFTRIPLGLDGHASGPPLEAAPYSGRRFSVLPLNLLPRQITLPVQENAPDGEIPAVIYTVKRGETLYSIGRCFGVSHLDIAAANTISDPGLIYVGQQLVIPTAEGTIPPTASNKTCTLPVYPPPAPVDGDSTATPGDLTDTGCTLNWCNAGQPWEGKCSDPNPLLQDWMWTKGWYEACYEAGYISSIPADLLNPPVAPPPTFSASWACHPTLTDTVVVTWANADPADSLYIELADLFATIFNATTSGASGSVNISTSFYDIVSGYIQGTPSGKAINFSGTLVCP